MKTIPFLFLLICFYYISEAQEVTEDVKRKIEDLSVANSMELQPGNELARNLVYYQKHRMNLNHVSANELADLHILTAFQIEKLFEYKKRAGAFINLYELQSIPGWDLETIQKILPYVTVEQLELFKFNLKSLTKGEQTFVFNSSRVIELSKGYQKDSGNRYLGNPYHMTFQYRYRVNDLLQIGFSGDKDPGEPFFKGSQSAGFDFYSFHLFLKPKGWMKALALGDFNVNMGQGLIRWQSMAFRMGSSIEELIRQSDILTPSRSSTEFNYNRGIGITMGKGSLQTTLFYSIRKISAGSLNDSTNIFSSMLRSGLHRTASEIAGRNKITVQTSGANVTFLSDHFKLSMNVIRDQFSSVFQKRQKLYNLYAFTGDRSVNGSIDYMYFYKNLVLFGETAVDKSFNPAFTNGLLMSINKNISWSVLYRNFTKSFTSLLANPYSQSGGSGSEEGFYTCLTVKLNKKIKFSAMSDTYHYPWLRYQINSPSTGSERRANISFQFSKWQSLFIEIKDQNKPLNSDSILPIYYPLSQHYQVAEMQWMQRLNNRFAIKASAQYLSFTFQSKTKGWLIYAETHYNSTKQFRSFFRLQYFNTSDYNSRIYNYEYGNASGTNTPAFYGKGWHYLLNVSDHIFKKCVLSLHWMQSWYPGSRSIGSGLDQIQGSVKSQVEMECTIPITNLSYNK